MFYRAPPVLLPPPSLLPGRLCSVSYNGGAGRPPFFVVKMVVALLLRTFHFPID